MATKVMAVRLDTDLHAAFLASARARDEVPSRWLRKLVAAQVERDRQSGKIEPSNE